MGTRLPLRRRHKKSPLESKLKRAFKRNSANQQIILEEIEGLKLDLDSIQQQLNSAILNKKR